MLVDQAEVRAGLEATEVTVEPAVTEATPRMKLETARDPAGIPAIPALVGAGAPKVEMVVSVKRDLEVLRGLR